MTENKICAWCYYARMRDDICGIYCTGGFTNPDGTCDHFRDSHNSKPTMDDNKAPERATHKIKARMPLDKAIEAIQDVIDLANSTKTDTVYIIALEMAMDALKREAGQDER